MLKTMQKERGLKNNMKATAIATSNIALIKYWGKKDEKLRLPSNGSISVNLSNLLTTTTVEFSPELKEDVIIYNKIPISEGRTQKRVTTHLDRIRSLAKLNYRVKIVTETNFPDAAGLASSASGYAALTVAATSAAGLKLSQKQLSILARVASGSACRSIPDGYVEWFEGETNETSYAKSIFPYDYWKIAITVVIVSREKKEVSSTQGQKVLSANPFFLTRLSRMKGKIVAVKKLIKKRRFTEFGQLVEKEALELHAMTLTSIPPIIYWQPDTVRVMKLVSRWRKEGFEIYFTIDAGPNLFLISEEKNVSRLIKKLKENNIRDFIENKPSVGARLINKHLF